MIESDKKTDPHFKVPEAFLIFSSMISENENRGNHVLHQYLNELLHNSLLKYYQNCFESVGSLPSEVKIVILVTWTDKEDPASDILNKFHPFNFFVHLSPMNPRPKSHVLACLRIAHRLNAAAKDSSWVRECHQLEEGKPSFANEILMCSSDGTVSELFLIINLYSFLKD
jgi:hypothetical protein